MTLGSHCQIQRTPAGWRKQTRRSLGSSLRMLLRHKVELSRLTRSLLVRKWRWHQSGRWWVEDKLLFSSSDYYFNHFSRFQGKSSDPSTIYWMCLQHLRRLLIRMSGWWSGMRNLTKSRWSINWISWAPTSFISHLLQDHRRGARAKAKNAKHDLKKTFEVLIDPKKREIYDREGKLS